MKQIIGKFFTRKNSYSFSFIFVKGSWFVTRLQQGLIQFKFAWESADDRHEIIVDKIRLATGWVETFMRVRIIIISVELKVTMENSDNYERLYVKESTYKLV